MFYEKMALAYFCCVIFTNTLDALVFEKKKMNLALHYFPEIACLISLLGVMLWKKTIFASPFILYLFMFFLALNIIIKYFEQKKQQLGSYSLASSIKIFIGLHLLNSSNLLTSVLSIIAILRIDEIIRLCRLDFTRDKEAKRRDLVSFGLGNLDSTHRLIQNFIEGLILDLLFFFSIGLFFLSSKSLNYKDFVVSDYQVFTLSFSFLLGIGMIRLKIFPFFNLKGDISEEMDNAEMLSKYLIGLCLVVPNYLLLINHLSYALNSTHLSYFKGLIFLISSMHMGYCFFSLYNFKNLSKILDLYFYGLLAGGLWLLLGENQGAKILGVWARDFNLFAFYIIFLLLYSVQKMGLEDRLKRFSLKKSNAQGLTPSLLETDFKNSLLAPHAIFFMLNSIFVPFSVCFLIYWVILKGLLESLGLLPFLLAIFLLILGQVKALSIILAMFYRPNMRQKYEAKT